MATVSDRKLAVVTGASSSIGLELARQCAEDAFDLIVCAEDAALQSAADRLAQHECSVLPVWADLRTR